jgi:hypothetical protein
MTTKWNCKLPRMSGFAPGPNGAPDQHFSHVGPGQSYPQHYPGADDPLGEPLAIAQVARLLGCSPWTVRQKYLPQGLPCLRSGRQGKLIFYRNQITRWILLRQQKGVSR